MANLPPVTVLTVDMVTQEEGPRVKRAEDRAQGVAMSAGFEREDEGQDRQEETLGNLGAQEERETEDGLGAGVRCIGWAPHCRGGRLCCEGTVELPP